MALTKRDREFRLPKISYLDFKHLEMDRVLTAFFARLAHNGFPSRLRRKTELTTEVFVKEFLEHPEWFSGFENNLSDREGNFIRTGHLSLFSISAIVIASFSGAGEYLNLFKIRAERFKVG